MSALLLIRLVVGLSAQMPEFDPRPDHMGFVVGEVALVKILLESFRFPLLATFHRCYWLNHSSIIKLYIVVGTDSVVK